MGDSLAGIFLKDGILGAIIVALGIVIGVLWRRMAEADKQREALQELRVKEASDYAGKLTAEADKRIGDSKASIQQMLETNKSLVTALTLSTNAIEANTAMQGEIDKLVRVYDDDRPRSRK